MFGSVTYYTEHFMSIVMNRLVTNEAYSLEEYYVELQEEISKLDESEDKKHQYKSNLVEAYEKIKDYIYGVEKEDVELS